MSQMKIKIEIAKKLMKIFPFAPQRGSLDLYEIFNDVLYTDAESQLQEKIREASAQFRYDYDANNIDLLAKYFYKIEPEKFVGKKVLDLGSFTGGRLVYWMEKYKFTEGFGLDINPIFALAGNEFAAKHSVNAHFDTGFAESMPYADDSFDFIVSTDVFEHVRDVLKVVSECYRVLKVGGLLMTVFPQYYQPLEAHLGLVTKFPALHWFFSGSTLAVAYNKIIEERGVSAIWYARESPVLANWEKLPSLNGITVKKFDRIIKLNKNWKVIFKNKAPILSDGKKANHYVFRLLRLAFYIPARLPYLEELFLGRICWVIKKSGNKI